MSPRSITRTQDLGRGTFLLTLTDDPGLAKMEDLRKLDARISAVQSGWSLWSK